MLKRGDNITINYTSRDREKLKQTSPEIKNKDLNIFHLVNESSITIKVVDLK